MVPMEKECSEWLRPLVASDWVLGDERRFGINYFAWN